MAYSPRRSLSRLEFVRALALVSAAAAPACSATVTPDSAVPVDGARDIVSVDVQPGVDVVPGVDVQPGVDVVPGVDVQPGVDVVDAGAGCPAERPMTGQACMGMRSCDYSGGRCEITLPLLCSCGTDPSGTMRWSCGPNCAIGPLMPPELSA